MPTLSEKNIENFIRKNKDIFGDYRLPDNHVERFMYKLNRRIRNIISIVPYLIRVSIVTIVIFTASIIIWNNYIRKDRHEITLRNKISLIVNKNYSR
jgi:hypothetical protein